MPTLWLPPTREQDAWQVVELDRHLTVTLDPADGQLHVAGGQPLGRGRLPRLVAGSNRTDWVLLDGAVVRLKVNAMPVAGGLRRLRHGDAITFPGADQAMPLFFSAESPVRVAEVGRQDEQVRCPRCHQGFDQPTQDVVRCPACGVMYHQSEDRPCWLGPDDRPFSQCFSCGAAIPAMGGLQWTPTMD